MYYTNIAHNNFIILSEDAGTIKSNVYILNDKKEYNKKSRLKQLKFHVKSNDYFGTLATIIDLITQKENKPKTQKNKQLKKIKNDLLLLQKHYKITKK